MSDIASKRLHRGDCDALLAHFRTLSAEDQRLRFGIALGISALDEYVGRIDFERDALYGVFREDLSLAGVAHVARATGHAELGISVLAENRGQDIGSSLFERACAWARNRFIRVLFMHCLAENRVMMHIAAKSGMRIVTSRGESDAYLKLGSADVSSITIELMHDRLALLDYSVKSQTALGRRLLDAFEKFLPAAPRPPLVPEPQR